MTSYNKAVRDRIPEIIKKSGHSSNVRVLSNSEFLEKLENKLIEEVQEYQDSKSIEELSDIIEVVYRIAELKGTDAEKLEKIRLEKALKNGKFEKNLFLIDTDESMNYLNE